MGFSIHNPALIAASILGAVITKLATMQLNESALQAELEQWANYFFKVTNNLWAHYKYTSEQVNDYFTLGGRDLKKVERALEELVEAHGRDRDGTFQRMFSKKDEELDHMKVLTTTEGLSESMS